MLIFITLVKLTALSTGAFIAYQMATLAKGA